tara:strand:- start:64 stop:483 length:420 start_codon:yes stop_codon:yes gene_type:complete
MSSTLKVNTLTGVSTADSIAVTTGATTTVLQKGMLKATVHFNSLGGNTESEKLNVSGVDDITTGDYRINFAANFNTVNYIMTASPNDGGASTALIAIDQTYGTNTTARTDIEQVYVDANTNRTNADGYGIMVMFAGDLA